MLKTRIKKFVEEFEMPITIFCKKVGMSTASYYKWMNGVFNLSEERENRISEYLSKYGF